MTIYTPTYKVLVNAVELTDVTVANLTIQSGRTDIYQQPVAGYCQLQLLNFNNDIYDFTVGTGLTVEVSNSTGSAFVPIFGGYISDFTIAVDQTGSLGNTTAAQITALGALSKLPKIVDNGILSQDEDGDQIYSLLSGFLLGEWNQVPAATTWATYTPATGTWANALNLGLGEIDRPGDFLMIARSSQETDIYSLCAQIANSALGYLYEEANGNIGYADSTHRQDYLAANGYTTLDANHANGRGLAVTTRAGDIRNKYVITYGNNGNSTYTAENAASQLTYGVYAEAFLSNIKDTADAEDFADRIIALRADPFPKFQSITFELGNPEIDDSDRNALINIFMGLPVWIQNLPLNISGGSFEGYVEGWTFRASLNNLTITFNASPVNFSQIAVKWQQVNAAETWATLSPTLTWLQAIGAVA
jgi:hypothetical protein